MRDDLRSSGIFLLVRLPRSLSCIAELAEEVPQLGKWESRPHNSRALDQHRLSCVPQSVQQSQPRYHNVKCSIIPMASGLSIQSYRVLSPTIGRSLTPQPSKLLSGDVLVSDVFCPRTDGAR